MSIYRDGKLSSDAAKDASAAKESLLGRVRVASPCNEPWANMVGDDRARFCTRCAKDVYDLSAMTQTEAEDFVEKALTTGACTRFFQRADGTIITADCPEGVAMKRRQLKVIAVVAGGLAASMMACNVTTVQGSISDEASKKVNAPIGASAISDPAYQGVYK